MPVAIVTGASMGLGQALASSLAARGWSLVVDARDEGALAGAAGTLRAGLAPGAGLTAISGDVSDALHQEALAEAAADLGGLDLLVNNASTLGPVPMPALLVYPLEMLLRVFEVNVVAPLGLVQRTLPLLLASSDPRVLNLTSDAAVEHYESWGGYGSAKAALEHMTATLAAEEPRIRFWAVDPGDMRTKMHQDAFPGEDISDIPLPETVVPSLLALVERRLPSGRYRAADLVVPAAAGAALTATGEQAAGERAVHGPPSFVLPPELEASSPPEARGLTRDAVRMLVANRGDGTLRHTTFHDLPRFLREGDTVVVNVSGTLAAEVSGVDAAGAPLDVHLSTRLPAGLWSVELRRGGAPFFGGRAGGHVELDGGGRLDLLAPYAEHPLGTRLWVATVVTPTPLHNYLARYGRPIRYGYVRDPWPISAYQNVYATEPGSAEMPSAGRPFTAEIVTRLVARGVAVTPILLHTGVASLEASEPPYPEFFRVPDATARRVNDTHEHGGTVVAVGTTVVRALESVVDVHGALHPASGWTETVITPDRRVRSVDGLLTGWHEPEASHLAMLEAIAGRELLERSYAAALAEQYLWHEFGDVHLVLP